MTPNSANKISIRNVTSSPTNSQLGSAFNNTLQAAKPISEPLSIQSKEQKNDQTKSDRQSANIDGANPIVEEVKESSNPDGKEEVKVAEVGNKEAHVCTGSHEAMLECHVCGLFCHASCVSNVGSVKMCAVCLSKRVNKTNGNGNMPRIQEIASDEDERHDDLANLECDTAEGEEEEDEGMEEDESKADRGCATSGANSTKLNEVLSS